MEPAERAALESAAVTVALTKDGSATLESRRYGQTFHSHHGAVSESQHVFLEASGVRESLLAGERVRVLEVGFGTGLNFLLTAAVAGQSGARLEYAALERDLLPVQILAGLGYGEHAGEWDGRLLEFRRSLPHRPADGVYRSTWLGVGLELRIGDASKAQFEEARFSAIYHDAFSPDANGELWTPEFLGRLARALAPGGALVTYTVKGQVRRQLAAAGLEVQKLPGPAGGKREMLRTVRPGSG